MAKVVFGIEDRQRLCATLSADFRSADDHESPHHHHLAPVRDNQVRSALAALRGTVSW
jgi:hypothetical protein